MTRTSYEDVVVVYVALSVTQIPEEDVVVCDACGGLYVGGSGEDMESATVEKRLSLG